MDIVYVFAFFAFLSPIAFGVTAVVCTKRESEARLKNMELETVERITRIEMMKHGIVLPHFMCARCRARLHHLAGVPLVEKAPVTEEAP